MTNPFIILSMHGDKLLSVTTDGQVPIDVIAIDSRVNDYPIGDTITDNYGVKYHACYMPVTIAGKLSVNLKTEIDAFLSSKHKF